jgi:bifunctional DNA-binding transcriptional regulator/antitoxin component of YhaV-PrlF toxin-antitoxin module
LRKQSRNLEDSSTVKVFCCYTAFVSKFRGYVGVQSRGTIALPAELRRRYHLDEQGAQVEITERDDGVLELRPALPVPADQRWFWTPEWQAKEFEASEDLSAGRVETFESGAALIEALERINTAE